MKKSTQNNLYKKNYTKFYDKSIKTLIDSLYDSIYKLRKRIVDKEKYIRFLKTSLEECGRDYKKEFKEYKKVLRQNSIDPFISASRASDNKGKNYTKNKRRREKHKKVVGSPMARQDTNHRIVVEDKVHQVGESSNDESFHTCIDETEELMNAQREQQSNSLPLQPNIEEEHMTEKERQDLIEFLVRQRQIQEEEHKQRYLLALEDERREQEAFENYKKRIEQYNKSTPAEVKHEELEEICTDSVPQSSSEPCKVVEKGAKNFIESPVEKILDPSASLPPKEENKEEIIKPHKKTKKKNKKKKQDNCNERTQNPFESLTKNC
jgi:hypothetical protein